MRRNVNRLFVALVGVAMLGLAPDGAADPVSARPLVAAGETQRSVLRRILLRDDKEPNASGEAEVFAVVSGIGIDGRPRVEIQPMPWLEHDRRWYYPDHVLVDWSRFGTGYVNVQLFEDDGASQYDRMSADIAAAFSVADDWTRDTPLNVVRSIGEVVMAVLKTRILANETDYVDSFYVIERGKKYLNHNGAGVNAMITIEPDPAPPQ